MNEGSVSFWAERRFRKLTDHRFLGFFAFEIKCSIWEFDRDSSPITLALKTLGGVCLQHNSKRAQSCSLIDF